MATSPKYHLTHRNLVGERFEPEEFGSAKIAFIGFCPPPAVLSKYKPRTVTDQHFIHVSPNSVRKFTHGTMTLLSLAHVYGGPVASATVEELSTMALNTFWLMAWLADWERDRLKWVTIISLRMPLLLMEQRVNISSIRLPLLACS